MRAARARVRLRPWRTDPSSSDTTDTTDVDAAPREIDLDPPDEMGATTRLHPSITREHRGPLALSHEKVCYYGGEGMLALSIIHPSSKQAQGVRRVEVSRWLGWVKRSFKS